jgi:hypothetical protein
MRHDDDKKKMTGKAMQLNSRRSAVATKRWILFLLAAAMTSFLAGCSSSTANLQNPQAPPQSQVAISVQTSAASVAVNGTVSLTATVTNDPTNAGADWTLVCSNTGNCGTLCPPNQNPNQNPNNCGTTVSSVSGATITYTAPAVVPASTLGVEIVAYANANQAKNSVNPITVTTFDANLQAGTYILQAQGADNGGVTGYQFAGAIVLDGNGNVTSGEQTINFFDANFRVNALVSKSDAITGGSYFLGSDGRGTITIETTDTDIGYSGATPGNGVETFAFVYLSSSQALISQMDLGSATTGASATGTLDLQTSTAAPAGAYAFVVSGTDVVKAEPVAFGGVFNVDSATGISGNGSVTDEILAKKVAATALGLSGTLTAPDQFGGFTLNLTVPFGTANKPIPVQFEGYIVDAAHIKLIESDDISGNAAAFGTTAGFAIGQGTAAGNFNDASFSGTYAFGVTGVDLSVNNPGYIPFTSTAVSLFTADGAGCQTDSCNGYTDTFLQLNCAQLTCTKGQEIPGAQISYAFTGGYSVDSTGSSDPGTGRGSLNSITFPPALKPAYSPTVFFYLTGLTGTGEPAALVLAGGDSHYPSVGTGIAYLQSGTAAFTGDYGFSFTQLNSTGENDGTAQLNANPTATPPVSGLADVNIDFGADQDQPFTGTFSTPTAAAPFAGSLLGTISANSVVFSPQIAVDNYFIDSGHGFWIETDLISQQSGQVSLGYYATRTPVCSTCP